MVRMNQNKSNITDCMGKNYLSFSELNTHLTDPNTISRMRNWSRRDCQLLLNSNSIESLHEKMSAKVSKRIKTEINEWDVENHKFQKINDALIAIFKKEFRSMETERLNIERGFQGEEDAMKTILNEVRAVEEVDEINDDLFTTNEKLAIGLTSPLWVPIGLVISLFALPVAGIMALHKKRKEKKALKEMKENIERGMADLTDTMLRELVASPKLKEALQDKLQELMQTFDALLEEIPRFIDADRKMLRKMESEVFDRSKELVETYRPLYDDVQCLIADMNCIYL